MTAQYYINQIDKVMDDSQFDARISYYMIAGLDEAVRNDFSMLYSDMIRVRQYIICTLHNLKEYNPQMHPVIQEGES